MSDLVFNDDSITKFESIVDIEWNKITDYMSGGYAMPFLSHCDRPDKSSMCDTRVPQVAGDYSRVAITNCSNMIFNERTEFAGKVKAEMEAAGLMNVVVRAFVSENEESRVLYVSFNTVEEELWMEMLCFVHPDNWVFVIDNDCHLHIETNTFCYYSSHGSFDGFRVDVSTLHLEQITAAAVTAFDDYAMERGYED